MERNIQLERPVEYLTDEVNQPRPEVWMFNGLKPSGEGPAVQKRPDRRAGRHRLAPGSVREEKSGTVLTPSADFCFRWMPPRAGDFTPRWPARTINLYIDYPYIFPGDSIESIYADTRLNPDDVAC